MTEPQLVRQTSPDYYARALALWPRLDHPHPAWVRHDPKRLACLIARRTNLSHESILALLGAPEAEASPLKCRH